MIVDCGWFSYAEAEQASLCFIVCAMLYATDDSYVIMLFTINC